MRKRTQYLIAKSFQLRFAAVLTLVGGIVTAVVGVILYKVLAQTQTLLLGTGLVTSPQVIDFLAQQRSLYIYSLIAVFLGVTLLLLILGIFVSHRIAGPLFALSRRMTDLASGNFNATLSIRQSDEFQDIKDKYNTLVHALQNQVKSELIKVDAIIKSLEGSGEGSGSGVREILRDLRTYYTYKKNLIEPSSPQSFKPKEAAEEELLV